MSVDSQLFPPLKGRVFFERRELVRILNLYGRMVALGEWRDYAMDGLSDARRKIENTATSERPSMA